MSRIALTCYAVAVIGCSARGAQPPAPQQQQAAQRGPRAISVAPDLVREGRVRVGTAERRALRGELVLVGEVMAGEGGEADVSTLVEGRIAELTTGEGERVRRGQVLAWIDAPAVGRARAEVLRASSRAQVAARQLARQVELDQQQATSKNAVDEARANDAAARTELAAARTLLASVGGNDPGAAGGPAISTRVAARAPIDGVVVKRNAVIGGPVAPDKPLFHIVSTAHAYVRARLPETAPPLREGTEVTLRPREAAGAAAPTCRARVVANFGWVDEGRSVPLRIAPTGDCPSLVVGRYVDVLVTTASAVGSGVVVSKEAAVDVKGATVVFVEAGEGRFLARPVRLGASTASEVVIESGVDPGERVVTGGAILLKGELLRAELEGAP